MVNQCDFKPEIVQEIPQYFTRGLFSNIQIPRDIQYFHPNLGYTAYLLRYGFDEHIYDGINGNYILGMLENLSFRLLTTLFILKKIQITSIVTQDSEFDRLLFEVNRMFCDENRINLDPEILIAPFGPSNNQTSFLSIAQGYNFPTDNEIPLIDVNDLNTLFWNIAQRFISI